MKDRVNAVESESSVNFVGKQRPINEMMISSLMSKVNV